MSIPLDDFQGHVTVQHLVVSAIDNPHSSFPNLRHDAAVTGNLTNHKALLAANVRLRFRYQSMNAHYASAASADHPSTSRFSSCTTIVHGTSIVQTEDCEW